MSGPRSGRSGKRSQTLIVAGQAALAVWAVVAAVLLVRSVANLRSLDAGFDETGLHVVQVDHPHDLFNVPPDWPERVSGAAAAIGRVANVVGATPVLAPPLVVNGGYDIVPTLEAEAPPDRALPYVNFETVLPGYFETLGLAVVRGRPVTDSDVAGSQPVVVVNEAAARALWPGEEAIGRRLELPWPGYEDVLWTVVGVAADARYRALLEVRPSVYAPLRQMSLFAGRWIAVRTRGPVDLAAAVQSAFADFDPGVRVVGAASVPERMSAPLARPRFALAVLGTIASIILVLAAVGAYGVVAARVRSRSHELGVRMACGATPAGVGGLILREAAAMAAPGAAAGVGGAIATGRFVDSLAFGVETSDPILLAAATLIVMGTALAACVSPAIAASRTDPLSVLRADV